MVLYSGTKIECMLYWTKEGWSKDITYKDSSERKRELMLLFDTKSCKDYRNFPLCPPPIFEVAKALGVPIEHILVTVMTKRFAMVRPYLSIMSENFSLSPSRAIIGQHDVSLKHLSFLMSDSRETISFH